MGLISTLDKMRLKYKVSKQVREAAAQMWAAVQAGKTFEVPIIFDGNDPTMQAVWLLFRLHPELRQVVRQSRSFILTHPDRLNLSADTQELMRKGGQFAAPEKFVDNVRALLGGQESFLEGQGFDPKQMEKEAQERDAQKHAMGEVAVQGGLVLDGSGIKPEELSNEVGSGELKLVGKFAANDVTGPTTAEQREQEAFTPAPHAGSPVADEPVHTSSSEHHS